MSGSDRAGSERTVLVALAANLAIAAAKLVGGLVSGSAAMLAEAAHSVADSFNEVALLVSIPLGRRPPDEEHPLGHGNERFFWVVLVAVGMFVVGAAFSIGQGVYDLTSSGEGSGPPSTAYAVLGVSLAIELRSLATAVGQMRRQARRTPLRLERYIVESKDPAPRAVMLEDGAAVAGIVLAAAGILLRQLTGDPSWDAWASIAIGVLLAFVAVVIGRDARRLLLGSSARPDQREAFAAAVRRDPRIETVDALLTMHFGPEQMLVLVRVGVGADTTIEDFAGLRRDIEDALRAVEPAVARVVVEPAPRGFAAVAGG